MSVDTLTLLHAPGFVATKIHAPSGTKDYSLPRGPFKVTRHEVDGLGSLASLLQAVEIDTFLVRGRSDLSSIDERSNSTLSPESHRVVVLDFDGPSEIEMDRDLRVAAEVARSVLPAPFDTAGCLVQATSSAGIVSGIRLRFFFVASRALSDAECRDIFRDLDPSIYKPSQPIYVHAPVFEGGRVDPYPQRWVTLSGPDPKLPPIRLNDARLPGQSRDWVKELTTCAEKHTMLVAAAAAFGSEARKKGLDLEQAKEYVWATCEKALRLNKCSDPVEDWAAARKTAEKQAAWGWEQAAAETDVLKEATEIPEGWVPSEKAVKKALDALNAAKRELKAHPAKLYDRAVAMGRHTPHILDPEHVRKELFKVVTQTDSFVAGAEADAKIAAGLAQGAKNPINLPLAPNQWAKLAGVNGDGLLRAHVAVLEKVLVHHPKCAGILRFNVRTRRAELCSNPPWHFAGELPQPILHDESSTIADCAIWFSRMCVNGDLTSYTGVFETLCRVAQSNPYDPFREWLDSLSWDGVARLDGWLNRYCGVAESEYASIVGSRWLIGAVARTIQPGCKADHALVLCGGQGVGKSTALRVLAGDEYFRDSIGRLDDKDSSFVLERAVIVELAELASMSKATNEVVKAYLSNSSEEARPAYGRDSREIIRRATFAGTTNNLQFLKDPTGNRRFWPVEVGTIDLGGLKAVRDQLWAEALHRYNEGGIWYPTQEEAKIIEAAQEAHLEDNPLLEDCMFFTRPYVGTSGLTTGKSLELMEDQIDPKTSLFRWVGIRQLYTWLDLDRRNPRDQVLLRDLRLRLQWVQGQKKTHGKVVKVLFITNHLSEVE